MDSRSMVTDEMAEDMRSFAVQEDRDFLALPHMEKFGGFYTRISLPDLAPIKQSSAWNVKYGYSIHAETALLCVKRADQIEA